MSAPSLTAVGADDEQLARDELCFLLSRIDGVDVIAQASDGTQALEDIARLAPDVAFLDIRMPGLTGLEVAAAAGGRTHVVFITAYEAFAVQAFEEGAVDYLLKPVSAERLERTVERIQSRLQSGTASDVSAVLARIEQQLSPTAERLRWISANVGEAVRMIPIDEVLFFQAHDKYTRVVTADGEAHIRLPLKTLMPGLDPDVFWRVHRGAIVRVTAVRWVKRDEDGQLRVHVVGRTETLPVSSAYAGQFRGL